MRRHLIPMVAVLLLLALGLAACGGGGAGAEGAENAGAAGVGNPEAGQKLFVSTCSSCHGPAGEGVPGLGKDMTGSEFIASQSDAGLIDFIKKGRAPDDPLNTTGVMMPPKGGNPALSDQDLLDIVAYIRSIHN